MHFFLLYTGHCGVFVPETKIFLLNCDLIRGKNFIVEIDETLIVRQKLCWRKILLQVSLFRAMDGLRNGFSDPISWQYYWNEPFAAFKSRAIACKHSDWIFFIKKCKYY